MAMYKVRFVVYKKPTGKTMFLPTFVRAVGSFCACMAIFVLFALVLAVFQYKGQIKLGVAFVMLVAGILGIALGVFLRSWAERKAQITYLKTLAEMEQANPEQKPN